MRGIIYIFASQKNTYGRQLRGAPSLAEVANGVAKNRSFLLVSCVHACPYVAA